MFREWAKQRGDRHRQQTADILFNFELNHLCLISTETSAHSQVAVVFSWTKTIMSILLQQEGFKCLLVSPIFKSALKMGPWVVPKRR